MTVGRSSRRVLSDDKGNHFEFPRMINSVKLIDLKEGITTNDAKN